MKTPSRPVLHVCALTLALAAVAPSAAAQDLSFAVAGSEVSGHLVVLDLGPVGRDVVTVQEISVENTSDRALDLWAYPSGGALAAWWDTGRIDTELAAGGRTTLHVELDFARLDDAEGELSLQYVSLFDEAASLATLVVDYELFPKARSRVVFKSGTMGSPAGKGYSDWFRICSGPAPEGFRRVHSEFELEPRRGGNRTCGRWAKCRKSSDDADGVCHEFKIQGHEAKFPDGAESRYAEGILRADYELVQRQPELHSGEETTAPGS